MKKKVYSLLLAGTMVLGGASMAFAGTDDFQIAKTNLNQIVLTEANDAITDQVIAHTKIVETVPGIQLTQAVKVATTTPDQFVLAEADDAITDQVLAQTKMVETVPAIQLTEAIQSDDTVEWTAIELPEKMEAIELTPAMKVVETEK